MRRVQWFLVLAVVCLLAAGPAFAAEKEWTFMVFLNADNNLDSFGVDDQNEMAKVGSTDYSNIICLIDRENGPATLNYIEKGKIKKIRDMGEVDMGDYNLFVSFVTEMAKAYPAKHYAAVIWNHGSGWDKKSVVTKGISYDDSSGNHITTAQLTLATAGIKKALGKNLDVLCFDACLMQMMEVAFAVRQNCDFVMASEETEPGEGYPYDDMLRLLRKDSTPAQFVAAMVGAYDASYNGGSQGNSDSTQSALDCAKLGELKTAIDAFAKLAIAGSFAKEFKAQLAEAQEFYYSDNKDLIHFMELVKEAVADESLKAAAQAVISAGLKAVVANSNNGDAMANANGLAIFFPEYSYSFSSEYLNLDFAKESLWDEMVQDYYKKISATTILADLANGDVASLRDFVASANANNRDVAADLIARINFRAFAENTMPASVQGLVASLLNELKAK